VKGVGPPRAASVLQANRPTMGRRPRLSGGARERARDRRRLVRRGRKPVATRPARAGERVLDLGSGAGTDSLIAAQMVGEHGHVTGIDMTPEMLTRARAAATEMDAASVEFGKRGGAPAVPDASFTYARSKFEDTRRKARSSVPAARPSRLTRRATKPSIRRAPRPLAHRDDGTTA
jgi:SAM-dependent methyltransferase